MEQEDQRNKGWSIEIAKQIYNIDGEYKSSFLNINDKGHLSLIINGKEIDLYELIERHGVSGVILRVLPLIKLNMDRVYRTFMEYKGRYNYGGNVHLIYPLKVNTNRLVIDTIYKHGLKYKWGFNVTSSAELDLIAKYIDEDQRMIVLDGYKNESTLAKLEKFREKGWFVIVDIESRMDAKLLDKHRDFNVGLRIKFMTRGKGPWKGSAGLDSKFGLSVYSLDYILTRYDWVYDKAILLHTHPGSQIYSLDTIKRYFTETTNLFNEIKQLGLSKLEYIDFGGGLPYPYHESKLETIHSPNYGLAEYVEEMFKALITEVKEHPHIVFECGRYIVASHRIVVSSIPDYKAYEVYVEEHHNGRFEELKKINDLDSLEIWLKYMYDRLEYEMNNSIYSIIDRGDLEFEYGLLEKAVSKKAKEILNNGGRIEELLKKHKFLKEYMTKPTHRFYAVFSVFAHIPDKLIVNQYFQIVPLQRLYEKPEVLAVLTDLTCDSMGEYGDFISYVKNNPNTPEVLFTNVDSKIMAIRGKPLQLKGIPLHRPRENERYYVAILDTGAYQDNLSMNHNSLGTISEIVIDDDNGEFTVRFIKSNDDGFNY